MRQRAVASGAGDPGADDDQRWSVDFASDTLSDGRRFRVFCMIDDFTR